MNKDKLNLNNMRSNLSGLERFAHKYMVESLTVAAIIVGAFSSWAHLFLGTLTWSVVFMVIGAVLGIFLPTQMDMIIKKIYSFSRSGKQMSTIVAEAVKIAIALFIPVVYFAFLGALAGTAYQYYVHYSQSGHKGK